MKKLLTLLISFSLISGNLQAQNSSINIDLNPLITQLDIFIAQNNEDDMEREAKKLADQIAKLAEEYGENLSQTVIRKLSYELKQKAANGEKIEKEKVELLIIEVNEALAKSLDQDGSFVSGLGYATAGVVVGFIGVMVVGAIFAPMRSSSNGGDAIALTGMAVIGAIATGFAGFFYGLSDHLEFEMQISSELDRLLID